MRLPARSLTIGTKRTGVPASKLFKKRPGYLIVRLLLVTTLNNVREFAE